VAKNPYFEVSEGEVKLYEDLAAEARDNLRNRGWTDEQIDAGLPGKAAKKVSKPKKRKGSK